MELIHVKILDQAGHALLTCPGAEHVSLVYNAPYKPGDRIAIETGTPGQYLMVQFEDTMAPALLYVTKREINFHIPFGDQAVTYSPKSFAGDCHVIPPQSGLQPLRHPRRHRLLSPRQRQCGDPGRGGVCRPQRH